MLANEMRDEKYGLRPKLRERAEILKNRIFSNELNSQVFFGLR